MWQSPTITTLLDFEFNCLKTTLFETIRNKGFVLAVPTGTKHGDCSKRVNSCDGQVVKVSALVAADSGLQV